MAERNGTGMSGTLAATYWEDRARRFAGEGEGLAAVCSYGMPEFYNRSIQLAQRLALAPWLTQTAGKQALDIGCGVGRWSRIMAAQGAHVTGVDISPTMIAEATRRAEAENLSERCRFMVQDLTALNTRSQYQFILGVTVLQHILELPRLRQALRLITGHLARDGRMVLVEAAPSAPNARCDSPIFMARSLSTWVHLFAENGLRVEAVTGIDPMPLKTWFMPYYGRLPKPAAAVGLAAVTAVSLPLDALFGRRLVRRSWHKLFVLRHASGGSDGA